MIIINLFLNFNLSKNNVSVLIKNNVAYYKKFDKIMFEIDAMQCYLILRDDYIEFQEENTDYAFKLTLDKVNKCEILLKKENVLFPITIEELNVVTKNNYIEINYKLETDEDLTKIVIEGIKYDK